MLNENTIAMESNNYIVICNNESKQELEENTINWYVFRRNDIYYDNIGNRYIVSFIDNDRRIVILEENN